jgi:hypothetical protein
MFPASGMHRRKRDESHREKDYKENNPNVPRVEANSREFDKVIDNLGSQGRKGRNCNANDSERDGAHTHVLDLRRTRVNEPRRGKQSCTRAVAAQHLNTKTR